MSPLSSPPPAGQGSPALSSEQLFHEIELAVIDRQFAKADALRDQLLAAHPMALSHIIKASEIIDTAKAACIDREHLATWATLYDPLSPEERNCLFYSMRRYVIPSQKLLLKQGGLNYRLFFIEKGRVDIFYPKNDKIIPLAQLSRGNLLGEYAFATISLCSASAVTHGEVELYCLESKNTDGWEENCPGLYDKLIDYCLKHGKIDEITRGKKLEKRQNHRYTAQGRVSAVLLDENGKKTETIFHGELADISMSGTCFMIHCPKKNTARALLAKNVLVSINWQRKDRPLSLSALGRIVRVSFHLYDDYSLHIGFHERLNEQLFENVTG